MRVPAGCLQVGGRIGFRMADGEMGATGPAVLPWELLAAQVPAVMVAVNSLRRADSPRLNGENGEHVRVLADSPGPLPPILVHRPSMQVIDGMHRLHAALIRGQDTIPVRFVDCDDKDVFVIAVQANTAHGLPLSLAERKTAAARIIGLHPHWSDRLVAQAAGLSPKTVAALRRRATGDNPQLLARTGRDGRVRPLSSAAGRKAAADALTGDPAASLQQVATAAGISPGTVRDVRDRLARGQDPVLPARPRAWAVPATAARPVPGGGSGQPRLPGAAGHTAPPGTGDRAGNGPASGSASSGDADAGVILRRLTCDPALRFSDTGRAILRHLHASTAGIGELSQALATVPPHSAITISKLARANARKWMELARQLDENARRT